MRSGWRQGMAGDQGIAGDCTGHAGKAGAGMGARLHSARLHSSQGMTVRGGMVVWMWHACWRLHAPHSRSHTTAEGGHGLERQQGFAPDLLPGVEYGPFSFGVSSHTAAGVSLTWWLGLSSSSLHGMRFPCSLQAFVRTEWMVEL